MRIETYEFIQDLEILRQELHHSMRKLRSAFPGHSEFMNDDFEVKVFILPNENCFQLFICHAYHFSEYLSLMIDLDKDVDYKNTIHPSRLIELEKLPMCLRFINKYVNDKGTE